MAMQDIYSFDDVANTTQLLPLGWFDNANMFITSAPTSGAARTGTQCVSMGTGGLSSFVQSVYRVPNATYYEYGCIFAGVQFDSFLNSGEYALGFGELPGAIDWHLVFRSTGVNQFEVRRGVGGTVLGTTNFPGGLQQGVWYSFAFRFRIHDTLGYIHCQINSVDVIAMTTGLDTKHTSGTLAQGKWNCISHGRAMRWWDDYHIAADGAGADAILIEGTKIYCKFPDTEGSHNGSWAPSTGTDEADVTDESPGFNTTDWISSNTVGHKSTYNKTALGVTGTVNCMQLTSYAAKDVSGDVRKYKNIVRIASTGLTYQGAIEAVPSAENYAPTRDMFELNPATASAFTIATADDAQPGVELTV